MPTYAAPPLSYCALQQALLAPGVHNTPEGQLSDRMIAAWPQAGDAAHAALTYCARAAASIIRQTPITQLLVLDWPHGLHRIEDHLAIAGGAGRVHIAHVHQDAYAAQQDDQPDQQPPNVTSSHAYAATVDARGIRTAAQRAGAHLDRPLALVWPGMAWWPTHSRTITQLLLPGSAAAIAHITRDGVVTATASRVMHAAAIAQAAGLPASVRSRAAIEAFLGGLRLAPPGLHQVDPGLPLLGATALRP